MPIVQVQMLRGRSADQKRRLIFELTRVMEDVVGADPERVNVVIVELDAESWGRGGVPLAGEPIVAKTGGDGAG